MLFYRAALPLSRQTLSYVAGVIRWHRARIGSRWCKLNPWQQALLVLAPAPRRTVTAIGDRRFEAASSSRHDYNKQPLITLCIYRR